MTSNSHSPYPLSPGLPPAQGLYCPSFEHDACGVGMVADIRNRASHQTVRDGLRILINLTHRGATGSDACTGDGAGILVQMPDAMLRERTAVRGLRLPEPGDYGAGLVFLPPDVDQRQACMDAIERIVRAEGLDFLGWRTVPVNPDVLGEIARRAMPAIRQMFIGRPPAVAAGTDFERKTFVVRKVIERWVRESGLPERIYFYIPSLSSRIMVYKGLLLADQIPRFFGDLEDETMVSSFALVHQRYSTNTFPTWDLAHPFRYLCHNGEINTLRGNFNWLNAREGLFRCEAFGEDLPKIRPVLTPGASDSAILDNAVELLVHAGRSLPHAVMMLIPEAWESHETMSDEKKAFYEFHACKMEPWDGPAAVAFTDGRHLGAVLDRNGLRPSRYTVTKDGRVILSSEAGVLEIAPENIERRGRLEPGRMLLVDLEQKRMVEDDEIKHDLASRRPYRAWLDASLVRLQNLPAGAAPAVLPAEDLTLRQQIFGYSREDVNVILKPMAEKGEEPTGSMGTDTPLAVLSERPQLLYNYFKQLFAQVTNPPLDAIREELVTSMVSYLGPEGNLLDEEPGDARQLRINNPILTNEDVEKIRANPDPAFRAITLECVFPVAEGPAGMKAALDRLCDRAMEAIGQGARMLILSDRAADRDRAPIPMLLAMAGVGHHLIRNAARTQAGLVVESAEPREVHHFAVLFGYGAGAVNPYLALETVRGLARAGELGAVSEDDAVHRYEKAVVKGIRKVMSKMGISTLRSYRGAQIFEAVGIHSSVIERYFTATPSRVEGIGLDEIAREALLRHAQAFPAREVPASPDLDVGGQYQWRRGGEAHLLDPLAIAKLQQAVRQNDGRLYGQFCELVSARSRKLCTLRGLMEFKTDGLGVPIEEVEPWQAIVRRFKTGAMSYGSISREAHETLAQAMNALGARSNSGEGGEDPERYHPDPQGGWRRSAIKQVASGRFGVTSNYLVNATELQIKIAQGAKPGEGGQLPGFKVYPWIAKTRHSTPYVTLISPPPHHDIYSIEDLAQLIFDLRCANPDALIDVKLVSCTGVGTVAAGVAKGKADLVLISGYDGGTGASPISSIKHAGLPWEIGLAETHQTLVLNNLRSCIRVETDGKLLTGRDVAIATLLGAEEFGFSMGPLVSIGCIVMRVCHLNTCPVGIATQDPELRARFTGKPEHIINYFRFVAEELRRIMASLGFRTVDEMIGRSDKLDAREASDHWKAKGLDLSKVLQRPKAPPHVGTRFLSRGDTGVRSSPDHELIERCRPALDDGQKVEFEFPIRNTQRTFGTMLSSRISKYYGEDGLPPDTIVIHAKGSAGQSFCAFGARGLTVEVEGEANDYFGKGLSGARLVIFPPRKATIVAEDHVLIGNVAFYGATSGEAYIRGRAGERFGVRNSGVKAVVEGVGDHGCEYMTGGRVVVLGGTGRNFAAGMSGGIAYVYDGEGDFAERRCNREMVKLGPLAQAEEIAAVRAMIERHRDLTGSPVAARVLQRWEASLPKFVRVMPVDYERALQMMAQQSAD
ncbi:MAG: glutamate synthase large subunit [Lentisphaerae bacterium]|nr:glutamate synthase large subunit [Lentisphaerota bacterium]